MPPKSHGMRRTKIYGIWRAMLDRCELHSHMYYRNYGGKGITVCERWHKFENFYSDMGDRPEGKSLDRINGLKGYYPGNCRWATRLEQARNRVDNILLEHNGVKKALSEWSVITKINYQTLKDRIERGWDIKEALETPARKINRQY